MHRVSILLGELATTLDQDHSRKLLAEARAIVDGLDSYLDECSMKPPAVLTEMVKATNETDWDQLQRDGKITLPLMPLMTSGSYEASVLSMLVKMQSSGRDHAPVRVLEIGMFVGACAVSGLLTRVGTTTLALARLPEVSKVVTLEVEPYLQDFVTPFFEREGVQHKIDIRIGDGKAQLQKLAEEEQKFDVAFIDADKGSYPAYFSNILDLGLLAPKGVILIDNSLFKSAPYVPHPDFDAGAKAIHKTNVLAVSDGRVETVMLPVRDGLTIARLRT